MHYIDLYCLAIESCSYKQRCQGSHQVYQSELYIVFCYCNGWNLVFGCIESPISWILIVLLKKFVSSIIHPITLFLSLSLCLSLPTSHAWISFHLSKHAVIHNTPSLARDKYINQTHAYMPHFICHTHFLIHHLPPSFMDYYLIKHCYLLECLGDFCKLNTTFNLISLPLNLHQKGNKSTGITEPNREDFIFCN